MSQNICLCLAFATVFYSFVNFWFFSQADKGFLCFSNLTNPDHSHQSNNRGHPSAYMTQAKICKEHQACLSSHNNAWPPFLGAPKLTLREEGFFTLLMSSAGPGTRAFLSWARRHVLDSLCRTHSRMHKRTRCTSAETALLYWSHDYWKELHSLGFHEIQVPAKKCKPFGVETLHCEKLCKHFLVRFQAETEIAGCLLTYWNLLMTSTFLDKGDQSGKLAFAQRMFEKVQLVQQTRHFVHLMHHCRSAQCTASTSWTCLSMCTMMPFSAWHTTDSYKGDYGCTTPTICLCLIRRPASL